MHKREHLLAIVEPTPGGDATLDIARDTVVRGGSAAVVMVVTERVRRDIQAYGESENLHRHEAEALALDQLRDYCTARVGDISILETHFGVIGSDLVRYVTAETTAIAVPARLVTDRLVERLTAHTGLPVTVTPSLAAVA